MVRTRVLLLVPVACVLLTLSLQAENWPHWRGPERTGVSPAGGAPLVWSEQQNVLWKLALPALSGATPIVWEDRVFLNVAEGGKLFLWSIDRQSGTALWKRELDDRDEAKRKGNMSSPSPVTDGRHVWVMTGTGVLAAFDYDGNRLWQRRLQRDYGAFGILHGYSSSPLLHEDTLYVQVLHGFHTDDPSYVLALDAATGENRWRVERPTDAPREAPDAYTTPALIEREGHLEVVISGADYVTGHDPATGAELWRLGGLNPTANPMQRIVASPTVDGSWILVPSRVKPLLALDASGRGAPTVAWQSEDGPDVPTPVMVGDHVFILKDRGIMFCLARTTGEVVWGPERIRAGTYSASPVAAGGRLYATNEEGTTTVLAAGPVFEVLAENTVDEYTLSSLAISDGEIFLRTAENLYRLGAPDDGADSANQPGS